MSAALPGYAELHCRSNHSFLLGASHPEELTGRAHALGYAALAITDDCSLGGVVRAHAEAKRLGLPLIVGAEMRLQREPGDGDVQRERSGSGFPGPEHAPRGAANEVSVGVHISCCWRCRAAATATSRNGSRWHAGVHRKGSTWR